MPKTEGPDKRVRDSDYESKLNLAAAACFGTAAGKLVFEHLRAITTNVASGPEITDRALMHLEGQRYLVGLLSQRINLGHKEKQNGPRKRTPE